MKINRISVWQLDLPLIKPYWLSGGRLKFEKLDSTFVRIDTDEGVFGWGEGCPWGNTYLPAHGPGIRAGIETLAPILLGEDPRSINHINRMMDLNLPGHPYVKSAIDIACWDILGKTAGMPLWQLFGGSKVTPVPVNSSISTGTADEMIALIVEARAAGYRSHSAKIGGVEPLADVERMDAICASLIPGESVTFDVNRAWTPAVALQVLNSVQTTSWIEQPCETIDQCSYVAKRVRQPVLLDECLHTFGDHLRAWQSGACTGLKIKPNRLGGLTKCKQVRDFAAAVGWKMHIEDVGGSALADTAAIHLASSTAPEFLMASWLCHYHLATDPVPNQGARNTNGRVTPHSLPGLGVEPDPDSLGIPAAVYR